MAQSNYHCCYHCNDRHIGCHAKCELYIQECKVAQAEKAAHKANILQSPVIQEGAFLGDFGHIRGKLRSSKRRRK